MATHYDFIVIGGGVLGTFHAYEALRRGLRVALLERHQYPIGSSVQNFGQVVPSGMNTRWQAFGRQSLAIYKDIQSQFDITVRQNGSVYLASDAEEMALLEELAERNRANDYPSELLSAAACLARYEGLRPDYCVGGLFFPEEITLEPRTAVHRVREYLIEQKGLHFFPKTLAVAVENGAGHCTVRTSDGRSFEAGKVLVCSGYEFQTLFPEIYLNSDLQMVKLQMLLLEAQPMQRLFGSILTGLSIRRYEAFSECPSYAAIKAAEDKDSLVRRWGIHILFKQTLDGSIILGDSHEYADAATAEDLGTGLKTEINAFMLAEAAKIFHLQNGGVRESWAGFYTQCKTQEVFQHALGEQVYLLTGIGGKGMTGSAGFAAENIKKIAGVYALRKPFTAASFSDLSLWGVQYKIALVAAQVAGYALSKCIGIRLIAGMGSERRAVVFLGLTGMALLSLLGLGLSPWPWGVFWMFLNGLPLGLAWGVVFSYLEGRRITDALAAFLCVNFIFSSGFVKTIGQWLMLRHGAGEFWMPFCVGALFLPLLLACLWILEQLPPPTVADVALRSERKPMTRQQQNALFGRYRLGLLLLAAIYLLLTVVRDVRDNFAVELWAELGMGGNPGLLTTAELPIVLCVLLLVGALSAVRDSFQALWAIHAAVVFGAVLAMGATLLFRMGHLSPLTWMVSSGTGIFGAYILFNGVIYDRLLAAFQEKGNVGFLIYMADAVGYLGSVAVLLWRNFGEPNTAWVPFYAQLCLVANGAALVLTIGAWAYFAHLKRVFYYG